tara:strand:+ start:71 stop:1180 length:1110 start_codon:yes stop_codon:yes gene_type:complete
MKKLVIINQRVLDWEKKGEIQQNYLNQNNKFNKIMILSFIKNDKVSKRSLQILCGSAIFEFKKVKNGLLTNNYIRYFLPLFFYKILIKKELKNLKFEKPSLVVAIGDGFVGYMSSIISNFYSCNVTISIHTFTSFKIFFKYYSFKEKIFFLLNLRFKKQSHKLATKILIVYKKISENINKRFLKKVELSYNQICISKKDEKVSQINKKTLCLVFVGRLIKGKSILNVIKSIRKLQNVNLTIYGDGDERIKIMNFIKRNDLCKRVFLRGFQSNKKILNSLKKYDAFVAFHKYYEFPKTIIEASLVGLPIILNRNPSLSIQEFRNLKILWTDDNVESYRKTIELFMKKKLYFKSNISQNKKEIKKILKSNG